MILNTTYSYIKQNYDLKERGKKVDRAKRPYEGTDAYEAGRKDAIKDLYEELIEIDRYMFDKASVIAYLRKKAYLNNV